MNAMPIRIAAVATLATLAFAATAQAGEPVVVPVQTYAYGGSPYYYGYHHASTPAESYLRGAADVIRSKGLYNLNTSYAMINREEARSRYYDNEIKKVDTYFEKRRVNKSNRAAERRPPMSAAELAAINERRQPDRLAIREFDPVLGIIQWPAALSGEEFADGRAVVEESFAVGAPNDRSNYGKVKAATDEMLAVLKTKIRTLETDDYIAARNFLEGVTVEARLPRDLQQVAAAR